MDLYLKQHIFTWGDRFTVYDADGNPCYYVEGEIFSWGKKLHLLDLNQNELAFISQKVFSFLPKYYVYVNGAQVAEIVKEITFFTQKYTVNGLGWEVDGDFFSHEYEVKSGMKTIVSVSKQWFTLGDAYEIKISSYADKVTALSVVLVVDACISASRNSN